QSRFVVTIAPGNVKRFEALMKGNVFADVGAVTARQEFTVMDGEKVVLSEGIEVLKDAWQKTLRW
ncbi:MAG: hypothetical protein QSU88_08190, partial [Candidatus Methanoperedens sp.]|nr:hypothetical protein [Candidatus Methanoperedens sp.]